MTGEAGGEGTSDAGAATRMWAVARRDLGHYFRSPLFWIWLAVVAFLAYSLSTGAMTISTGSTSVGGSKAWITSQFGVAKTVALGVVPFYAFFVSIAAGTSVMRDEDEWGVGALLHATPLRPREYVWGKFAAVAALTLLVLSAHAALSVFCNHVLPHGGDASHLGPLALGNYLIPFAVLGVPPLALLAGATFLVGERSRSRMLIYLFPVAILLATVFLWTWSPGWLPPTVNRALAWIDVTGVRWLEETYYAVDRGVEFYNTTPIDWRAGFVVSRTLLVLTGLGAAAWSARRFASGLGEGGDVDDVERAEVDGPGSPPGSPAAEGAAPAARGTPSAGTPEMTQSAPGVVTAALRTARSELRELRRQPGLYLFVPLILTQVLGASLVDTGAFQTTLLTTAGGVADRAMEQLALLGCLLLLFYTVQALVRDEATGLGEIARSTPVPDTARFLGVGAAMMTVAGVLLLSAFAGGFIAMLVEGEVPLQVAPFLWTWGALLLPTFAVWIAFVQAVQALSGNRYVTYGVGLTALGVTLWEHTVGGGLDWATNWMLWNAVQWTDMGVFPLNAGALLANRAAYLTLAVVLVAFAARAYRRRDVDAVGRASRLKPSSLAGRWALFVPAALVPAAALVFTWSRVENGFQGDAGQGWEEDYWRRNRATWMRAGDPAVAGVRIDLELWPKQRRLASSGTMTLVNRQDTTLSAVALTGGFHWRDVEWTVGGEPGSPENRSGLYVFRPHGGLAPGDSLRVGFSFEGEYPRGWTENGGGGMQFVTPAGVVLNGLTPSFTPVPGFLGEVFGPPADERPEPRERPGDHYRGQTDPMRGLSAPFPVEISVTGPAKWRFNAVGRLAADSVHGQRRTMTWRTEEPVRMFNVVATRWDSISGRRTTVFHHPEHAFNADDVSGVLEAAREHYAEWFAPYPWAHLKVSEFPALSDYGMGMPGNIVFSEGVGFLSETEEDPSALFLVTAHEAAHQWWGTLLTPGEGPGGNVLSEGMAHFSTALLFEEERGAAARRGFLERLETLYAERRRPDAERSLLRTTGAEPGDGTVTYDKGGWVLWMLSREIGRDNMLRGLGAFIDRYRGGPDYPVLQDFIDHIRGYAPDTASYNLLVHRWFRDVVLPRYRVDRADLQRAGADGDWVTTARVRNTGTGEVPVEVAAVRGERSAAETSATASGAWRARRDTVVLGPGQSATVEFRTEFEPERVVVDPDVETLMLARESASAPLDGAVRGGT